VLASSIDILEYVRLGKASRFQRIACGFFQLLAIMMIPFIQMACFIGPLQFYQAFQGTFSWKYFAFLDPKISRYLGVGVFFPLSIILFIFQILVLLIIVKWVVIGRYKQGN
jgi:hypothetical protein